jgi:DNA-binding FrmR family transcriptional regulator
MHTFPEITKRLKRAQGHLAGVIEMMQSGRECMELAQQLHAVEKALGNAKRELITDHLQHCLTDAAEGSSGKVKALIEEFQGVTKYL